MRERAASSLFHPSLSDYMLTMREVTMRLCAYLMKRNHVHCTFSLLRSFEVFAYAYAYVCVCECECLLFFSSALDLSSRFSPTLFSRYDEH